MPALRETLRRTERSILKMQALPARDKATLLELLARLKAEARGLRKTHREMKGLAAAVKKIEISHPKLVETADEVCRLLAGIGL